MNNKIDYKLWDRFYFELDCIIDDDYGETKNNIYYNVWVQIGSQIKNIIHNELKNEFMK